MEFRQIEAYWAVMSCGSVTAAARMLNVSQPAISKSLKRAEDCFGVKLFDRVGGRMIPTVESRALFPSADRIVRDIADLTQQARDFESIRKGVLRIGASSALAASVMPAAVAAFKTAHPRAQIISMLLPAAELVDRIRANALDLGYALDATDQHLVKASSIGTTRLACLIPEHHRLAARTVIRPQDLADDPIITFPETSLFGRALDATFRNSGIPWQIAIQVDLSLQAALFVQSGCGIALIDTLMRAIKLTGVVWRPFEPALAFSVYELSPSNRPLSRATSRFRSLLRKVATSCLCEP